MRTLFLIVMLLPTLAQAAYNYQYKITIDHLQAGTANTSSFTALVNIASDTNMKTLANGGKIQHTTTFNGQTVPADLGVFTDIGCSVPVTGWDEEYYEGTTTGSLVLWFGPITLSHTVDGTYYLCFGNPALSTYQGGSIGAAWSGISLGYHFANGTTLNANDFSGNTSAGTITGPPSATTGQIDGGAQFNIHSTDSVTSGLTTGVSTTVSVSFWTNITANTASMRWIDQYNSSAVGSGVALLTGVAVEWDVPFSGGIAVWKTSTVPSTGAWHFMVVTYDASSTSNIPTYYLDNVNTAMSVLLAASGTVTPLSGAWYVGNRQDGVRVLHGIIDEVRVYIGSIISSSQVTAEYNMQKASQNMVSLGSLKSLGGPRGAQIVDGAKPVLRGLIEVDKK